MCVYIYVYIHTYKVNQLRGFTKIFLPKKKKVVHSVEFLFSKYTQVKQNKSHDLKSNVLIFSGNNKNMQLKWRCFRYVYNKSIHFL